MAILFPRASHSLSLTLTCSHTHILSLRAHTNTQPSAPLLSQSASMGLSIACAIAMGYSNIFVTSPSPENLKTLFEFVFKGFDSIGLQEHVDYELVESTNPDWNGAIVRVNVFHTHRQTIQYIQPGNAMFHLR